MENLPKDIVLLIVSHIDGRSLLSTTTLNKHWNQVLKNSDVRLGLRGFTL
jgi:hypothetical protein